MIILCEIVSLLQESEKDNSVNFVACDTLNNLFNGLVYSNNSFTQLLDIFIFQFENLPSQKKQLDILKQMQVSKKKKKSTNQKSLNTQSMYQSLKGQIKIIQSICNLHFDVKISDQQDNPLQESDSYIVYQQIQQLSNNIKKLSGRKIKIQILQACQNQIQFAQKFVVSCKLPLSYLSPLELSLIHI
eukprot:TRINITY_DN3958_c0_g2_i1.p1 TRINITY_DN3958_c0_g2~~TRINITY_DN3958_c0_g2_i1.p1  ORF type:complete len:187 (-),score=24.64 TRINITY_DN3958_c0_g2_i1:7-567(-)